MQDSQMKNKTRIKKIKLLPPSKENVRNSEGSIVELSDGRLLLVYSHFYRKKEEDRWGGDNAPAYLAGRFSGDGGESWDKKDSLVIPNEGKENVMSVSLLRLQGSAIILVYAIKNGYDDCRYFIRKSVDETKTWGKKICVTKERGYYVVNNDRVIQISGGRLLVPACSHPNPDVTTLGQRGKILVRYSDDEGKTWHKSKTTLESPFPHGAILSEIGVKAGEWWPSSDVTHLTGFQEPGLVELADGSLFLWARTDLGCQYVSRSFNQGLTWSKPEPSELISPCSPASIKRIPKTGDLLVIYNDHSGRFPFPPGKRTPLVAAISKNGGRTWQNHKIIEGDPDGHYCYTAITFREDKVILAYCAGSSKIGSKAYGLSLTQITLLDLNCLYN